jgi:hypothetical protein
VEASLREIAVSLLERLISKPTGYDWRRLERTSGGRDE